MLRRFGGSPFYVEVSVGELRTAGFAVLATGSNTDHFDILLIEGRESREPLLPLSAVVDAAHRLLAASGEMRRNPSYAGGTDG